MVGGARRRRRAKSPIIIGMRVEAVPISCSPIGGLNSFGLSHNL
ncbi:hypothetical protein CEV34_1740 [Brucella pseudogrignonensis]|uniref:Uncharacterized protein n=1 Tax=Brucella pseudogrignonensis TaxID=419475 RepID=A0A256GK61_9HYPH|nr:hypothetical protein CEV34_1740 [Brucella pseudogrignonensis]